jgi:hypothetical protein
MREPKNRARNPRVRSHIVRLAANAAFGAHAAENQVFALPAGAKNGDNITITLVGPGDPLDSANILNCLLKATINSGQLIVTIQNASANQIARGIADARVSYTRP